MRPTAGTFISLLTCLAADLVLPKFCKCKRLAAPEEVSGRQSWPIDSYMEEALTGSGAVPKLLTCWSLSGRGA